MKISWNGTKQLSKNKSAEIQIEAFRSREEFEIDLFRFSIVINRRADHAGFDFTFEFLEFLFFTFNIYDHRHWNYDENRWYNETDVSKGDSDTWHEY